MKKTLFILLFAIGIASGPSANGQIEWPTYDHLMTPERHYVVYQSFSPIKIDGKADEASWQDAEWTDYFLDIEGKHKPEPTWQTRMKMLWDNDYLYFYAELEEPHVWSYYDVRDMIVFHENDFEIFIDPDGDTHHYFEFEFNARNTIFDLFMTKPYRNGGIPLISWDATGTLHAVDVQGTLNDPDDTDSHWTLEVAIPFKDLRLGVPAKTPEEGEQWRINFSRVQWQTQIKDGRYHRKKNEETGRLIPEDNWVWSPTGVINMHFPERWGVLQFTESPANGEKTSFTPPPAESIREHLWKIYYKQNHYRQQTGSFAKSLAELSEQATVTTPEGEKAELTLKATGIQYTVSATTDDGWVLVLDNRSHFRMHRKD